jgi:Cu/Ag efflux protein CusF
MIKPHCILILALLSASLPFGIPATAAAAEKSAETAKRHPLKGVVTAVYAERSALMVKHEEVPGVMRAMTMLFKVEEATLKGVKAGDHITALLSREEGEWRLHNVKTVAKVGK